MTPDESRNTILTRFTEFAPWAPAAHYDPDGDCVEFFFTNEPFRGRRLDRWVTVYYGRTTGDVVGSCIKDIRRLLDAYPGLNIDIHGERVLVSFLLRAPAWSSSDEVVRKTYKLVIEKAEFAELEAELAMSGR